MNIKQQVLDYLKEGNGILAASRKFGIPKSTVFDWKTGKSNSDVYHRRTNSNTNAVPYVTNNKNRDGKSKKEDVLEFLEKLAPIHVPPTTRKNTTASVGYAVVGSDFHFGCHSQKAIDIFLETIDELKPQTVVLNGDTMDFLAISRYPKDIKVNWSLQDERIAYRSFLADLNSVLCKDAIVFETYSNHSGQSVGGRWRRYLSDRLGELASLPDITDKLSYEEIFMGEYQKRIHHVDYVELNSLIVTHGDTVRKNGGYSARGEIEKWGCSILHGHTHRIGSSCQRIPAIGSREEKQLYGFEGGCLCSLDAVYSSAPNWQQGFTIVSLADDGDQFGIEQVLINNGKAVITTLGKEIKS